MCYVKLNISSTDLNSYICVRNALGFFFSMFGAELQREHQELQHLGHAPRVAAGPRQNPRGAHAAVREDPADTGAARHHAHEDRRPRHAAEHTGRREPQ